MHVERHRFGKHCAVQICLAHEPVTGPCDLDVRIVVSTIWSSAPFPRRLHGRRKAAALTPEIRRTGGVLRPESPEDLPSAVPSDSIGVERDRAWRGVARAPGGAARINRTPFPSFDKEGEKEGKLVVGPLGDP